MQFQRILLKRFQIPPIRKTLLHRKRLIDLFSDMVDYPVALVKAGAGFGKTTAVSAYVQQETLPVRWFTLTEEERDPATFVARFMEAMLPSHIPLEDTESVLAAVHHPLTWNTSAHYVAKLIGKYIDEDTLFVIDDFHVVDEDPVILDWTSHCFEQIPYQVHIILISRTEPALPYLKKLEARGEILRIREQDLAFTEGEIVELFDNRKSELPKLDASQAKWLKDRTGGMAIAVSMLWREWKNHDTFDHVQAVLDFETSLHEQLSKLLCTGISERAFALFVGTSVLSTLTPEICNYVLEWTDSDVILGESVRTGIVTLDEKSKVYNLHPLVREYFQQELSQQQREQQVRRIVDWFYNQGQVSRALGYLFAYQNENLIVPELLIHIPNFLERGQVSTVEGWLLRLSETTIEQNPGLLYAKGEVCRFKNQYTAAISVYDRAREVAIQMTDVRMEVFSLIGNAQLYLDTIQPSPAESYIRNVRTILRHNRKSHPDLRLHAIRLSCENAINSGRLIRAQRLQTSLHRLGYQALIRDNSDARLLLRIGKHRQAIQRLGSRVSGDEQNQRTALSHREATLLLSLLYAMSGDAEAAQDLALRGTHVGDMLDAPFVRAVGFIRLGHAQHLSNPLSDDALQSYEAAIAYMDDMSVVRGKSEAYMGLCLVYAYRGQFESARAAAETGMAIARDVQDFWMENLVRLAYGQACVICGRYTEAVGVLTKSEEMSETCYDPFLQLSSLLWKSLSRDGLADDSRFEDLKKALSIAEKNEYMYVFSGPTYFGLRDIQMMVPLLRAYHQVTGDDRAARILHQNGGGAFEGHPGYTLRVQTLGTFRVWRGFTEITRKEWQREKARQLFQFLVTHRRTPLHREDIAAQLWGIEDPQVAERDFKVALNVLSAAIEPNKSGRGTSLFIERNGGYYRLVNQAILSVDRDVFEYEVKQALKQPKTKKRAAVKRALALYIGEYLPDTRYETWSQVERDRLNNLFLKTALQYTADAFDDRAFNETIRMSERVIDVDPTREEAYVWLMRAYGALHMTQQVVQTFRACESIIRREYGVDVMETTKSVFQQLVQGHLT